MNFSFILLLGAAGIFAYLAFDAKRIFNARVARLLPRNVLHNHVRTLMQDFPQHLSDFRGRALPFYGLHIALNVAASAVFAAALWLVPPTMMSTWDLLLLQIGSLVIFPIAMVADLVSFFSLFARTFTRRGESN